MRSRGLRLAHELALSSDFPGGTKSQEVLSFLQGLVEHRHPKERKKPLYIFATQANDTNSIQVSGVAYPTSARADPPFFLDDHRRGQR